MSLTLQQGETLSRFGVRVDRGLPISRASAQSVVAVMMELSYSPRRAPTSQDVEALAQYRSRLDRYIRTTRGWWFYTLRETLRLRR